MTSIRRGLKNVKRGLGRILAAAACLVAATVPRPALAQQVVTPNVLRVGKLLDDIAYVYALRPILFLVPKGNTALLDARREDADALRARFADCESGLPDARAQPDVVIGEQITKNSLDLAPPLREILNKTGLGHLTPPETTERGVQLFAVCGARPSASNASHDESISEFDIEQRLTLRRRVLGPKTKTISRQEVIEELREERRTLQEAKSKGIVIEDSEIDQVYADMATRMHMTLQQMNEAFADSGVVNLNSFRERIRADLARRAVQSRH